MSDWAATLKNAKKTCIQQGTLRKVHYELPNGKEMVEEYNMDTGVVTRRAWKVKKELAGEGQWLIEVGDPEPAALAGESVIKEDASQPFISRRITKKSLEWRIRNLPYPIETYSVTVNTNNKCLTVRTTNKKYYKILQVPELERLNLIPEQDRIKFSHKYNTLIITYEKPQELTDFEKAVFEDVKLLKTRTEVSIISKVLKMKTMKISKGSKRNKLPERWNDYTAIGNIVPGTRFLPFKTPLREEICKRSLSEDNWFTPAMLLEKAPNLKLIVDLTQTDRYYCREDFIREGIAHKKIICPGGGKQLPPRPIIHEFNRIIDTFLESGDSVGVIGIHCTHGLNRTGYLICKYMVQRYGIPAPQAVEDFEAARGHKMERQLYIDDILGRRLPPPISHPHRQRTQMVSDRYNPGGRSYQQLHSPPERHYGRPRQQPYSPLEGCYDSSYRQPYSPLEGCYEGSRQRYSNRNSTPQQRRNIHS